MEWWGMTGSGNGPLVMRLLAEQRRRCLATVLNAAEGSTWWVSLSAAQQVVFREQVRSAISVFYDLTRDIVKVTDDESLRNEVALDLIRSIHRDQREIADHIRADQPRAAQGV